MVTGICFFFCIHFSFTDRFNVEFAMTLPFSYSARYWFDSGYASLFLAVQTYVAEGFLAVEATRQGSALPLLLCIFVFSRQDRIQQRTRRTDFVATLVSADLRVPRQELSGGLSN